MKFSSSKRQLSLGWIVLLLRSAFSTSFISSSTSRVVTTTKQPAAAAFQQLKMSNVAIAEEPRGGGKNEAGTATIPNEVFNLVKSIVGAGVLSLPAGIAAFGNAPSAVVPASVLIGIMGLVSAYTFLIIGRICNSTQTSSYAEAWDKTVKKGSWLVALSCVVDCFAGNLSYSMILADTFVALLAPIGLAVTRTQSLLGVTATILLPLCLKKNLSSLAPFSLVGILGMLYTLVAMVTRYLGKAYMVPTGKFLDDTILAMPKFGNVGASGVWSVNSLILTCMLSNAYIAHFNAPKFYSELKDATPSRFAQVTGWSFAISVLIYVIMSAAGFLTFGAASNGLILNNYSTKDVLMGLSRIAVTVSIIFSYPLIFVGTRDSLLDLVKVDESKRSSGLLNKVTLGILGVCTLLASKLTDLGLVASVGGATFGTALVFVYPAIMLMKTKNVKKEKWVAAIICALGLAMGGIGTYQSFQGVGV